MQTGKFITHSAEQTFELAYRIGERINASAVFLLNGDLGTGKTVFAKGLAAGLDIDPANVTSPTFTLVNYHHGRLRLYHLDLYRLAGTLSEIDSLGLEEMLAQQNAVVLIEWAERLSDYDIPGAYCVSITDENDDEREITIAQSSG